MELPCQSYQLHSALSEIVSLVVCLLSLPFKNLPHIFDLNSDIDLKEQYRLVELKKMLSQYGMRSFHVSYAARAKVK